MLKIGILTYHRAINYGAFLQAYGLCQRLNEESDIKAEIIDFHMEKEKRFYNFSDRRLRWKIRRFLTVLFKKMLSNNFRRSLKSMTLSSSYLMSDSIEEFQKFVKGKYDVIIAGSDEIWKVDSFRGFPTPYWLPGDLGCKKISYAASSRSNFSKLNEKNKIKIKKYLEDFSYISVRDQVTYENIAKYIKPNVNMGIFSDPSFVYDYKQSGQRGRNLLIQRANLDPKKKIAVIMLSDKEVANQIKKELSDEYQLVAVFERHLFYKNLYNLNPFEWLDVIAGVDLVCASFFHAICFSIICNTSFLAFNVDNKASKLLGVLEASDNMNRLIQNDDAFYETGFLKNRVKNLPEMCNGSDYIKNSRKKFKEYLVLLRKFGQES